MKNSTHKNNKRISKTNRKTSRRVFIKQIGFSYLIASSYSLISLSQFACSDSVSPNTDFTSYSYSKHYTPYYY